MRHKEKVCHDYFFFNQNFLKSFKFKVGKKDGERVEAISSQKQVLNAENNNNDLNNLITLKEKILKEKKTYVGTAIPKWVCIHKKICTNNHGSVSLGNPYRKCSR